MPFGKANSLSSGGQVLSAGLMKSSMRNGAFAKWLLYDTVLPSGNGTVSGLQPDRAVLGGTVRLTSFCIRQLYGAPACETCVVLAGVASERPTTCLPPTDPQLPYK